MKLEIINTGGIILEEGTETVYSIEIPEIKNFEIGKFREELGQQYINFVFSEKLTEEQLGMIINSLEKCDITLDRESHNYSNSTHAYLFEEDVIRPNLFINTAVNFTESKLTVALDLLPEDLFYDDEEDDMEEGAEE